jgi:hypothetical protein
MIEELLATEYIYVNDLKTLVNVFFTPLSNNPDVLPKEELPIIFSVRIYSRYTRTEAC